MFIIIIVIINIFSFSSPSSTTLLSSPHPLYHLMIWLLLGSVQLVESKAVGGRGRRGAREWCGGWASKWSSARGWSSTVESSQRGCTHQWNASMVNPTVNPTRTPVCSRRCQIMSLAWSPHLCIRKVSMMILFIFAVFIMSILLRY